MNNVRKHEEAFNKIKGMIISKEISNRNNVSENTLVRKLGMSRTPIRAALQRLQLEDFIKIVPNQGIIIQEVSVREAEEKYDLRIALELYVIKRVIHLLSADDFQNLGNILKEQKKACESADVPLFLRLDYDFHMYLLQVYNNTTIHDIVKNFRERFSEIASKALRRRDRMKDSLKEHERILAALEKRSLPRALQSLERHLDKGILQTMKAL